MDEELESFLAASRAEHAEKVFFMEQNLGAEVHWFFTQAFEALKAELYLPACTSFINGIEASLRVTLAQVERSGRVTELDPVKTLSNRLLLAAKKAELPVVLLSFPNEDDFLEKMETKRPNLVNVEIVRVRHNLCHGNILDYVNTELGEHNAFFTPECCRSLATILYTVSKKWAKGLGEFRARLNA
jgi:hypothetical protein